MQVTPAQGILVGERRGIKHHRPGDRLVLPHRRRNRRRRGHLQRLPRGDLITVVPRIPEPDHQIPDAIAWQPPTVQAGESYRITITRPSKATVTYDVELVDCDALDP